MVKRKRFATIKDVAEASGFSINTVSRALSGRGYVKKETKEKILKVAAELGYTRDCTASALRTRKTHLIGVVVVDNTNPFYAEVIKGIELEARNYGYTILLVNTDRSYENEERAINTLLQRRVDGLIITAVQTKIDDIIRLVQQGIPNVVIGARFEKIQTNYVCSDDERGGYIAMKYLLDTGHKNILFLNAQKHKYASRVREEGVRRALEEFKSEMSEGQISLEVIYSNEGFESAYETFKTFVIRKGQKFNYDALLCYNDIFAYAAIKTLKELGFKVPDDVSVVGFDDISFSSIIEPPLTTVATDKLKLGSEAFKSLIKNMETGSVSQIILPVELKLRNSTLNRIPQDL
ncbi:LacI family DNA-binding transcriptional regulator [Fervidobacterium islandicum]|uniref:LacI family transcriptional regulator n=1 Tax=Fervidobacterium islandicum TaxID=2423 RepID=A0AAI8CM05_FERIS|nr:LacI family DNA-binding transcriptional regulator [Fervidobacterium islandicum]AMW32882.1 LacI family transcriptional regulator [Fervidobacterium islandicum]